MAADGHSSSHAGSLPTPRIQGVEQKRSWHRRLQGDSQRGKLVVPGAHLRDLPLLPHTDCFLLHQAVEMLRARKRTSSEITIMLSDLVNYKNAVAPFDAPMQQTDTVETWWKRVAASQPPDCPKGIVIVARLVACVIAHAADPERAFSYMGSVHSWLRNRFNAATVGAMAEIKSFLQLCPPEEL